MIITRGFGLLQRIILRGYLYVGRILCRELLDLIPSLRVYLGDSEIPYEFSDATLLEALIESCKALMHYWSFRYLIDSSDCVHRNPERTYSIISPPIIQYSDEHAFILLAAIIIKMAKLTDTFWDMGAWKDEEISHSMYKGGTVLGKDIRKDWKELQYWLRKRLYRVSRQSLPGFKLPSNIAEGYK